MANKFIGTWRLISCELKDENGEPNYPFGQNPVGYIIYNENGYMSVAIMDPDRPKFGTNGWFSGTTEEKAIAFEGYASYSGKYTILEKENKVIHHPEIMFIPNLVNVDQERVFEFDGDDKLTLSTLLASIDEKPHTSSLVWVKVK